MKNKSTLLFISTILIFSFCAAPPFFIHQPETLNADSIGIKMGISTGIFRVDQEDIIEQDNPEVKKNSPVAPTSGMGFSIYKGLNGYIDQGGEAALTFNGCTFCQPGKGF